MEQYPQSVHMRYLDPRSLDMQNLLIITAIKADKSRVKDYIHRLDNFDGPAVGEIAVGCVGVSVGALLRVSWCGVAIVVEGLRVLRPHALAPASLSYELFEEAFEIYKKFGLKQQAIKVVLDHMEDLDRAHEFATKVTRTRDSTQSERTSHRRLCLCPVDPPRASSLAAPLPICVQVDEPAVWSELANSYLEHAQVSDAIDAFLRAADTSKYNDVIAKAGQVTGSRAVQGSVARIGRAL